MSPYFDEYLKTASQLHKACINGDFTLAMFCLSRHDRRFDVNKRDRDGKTPFHLACEYGSMDIVQMLLSRVDDDDDGNVDNETDDEGQTPLFMACFHGHLDIVQILLNLGADMEKENVDGVTPVMAAFRAKRVKVVRLLLDQGGLNVNATDDEGYTLLHHAVFVESIDLVRLLLDRGANVDVVGKENGLTPLHSASLKNGDDGRGIRDDSVELGDDNFRIAQLLLDRGADVNARLEKGGFTPLHFACADGHLSVIRLLLEHGADAEATASTRNVTPLHMACNHGELKVAWLLVMNELKG